MFPTAKCERTARFPAPSSLSPSSQYDALLRALNALLCPALLVPHLVLAIRQVQVPVRTLGREDHHANDTTRAAVPPDRLLERALDELHRLRFFHALLPVVIAVTIDICRSGPADRVGALVQ